MIYIAAINLFQVATLLLLCSIFVRFALIVVPAVQFIRLFEDTKSSKQGFSLIKKIEIPGLHQFVKQEFVLGVSPYLSIVIVLLVFDLAEINTNQLSNVGLLLTLLGLFVWLVIDWTRSFIVHQQLRSIVEETKKLRGISGNVLDGLKYAVYLRPSLGKTAFLLGKRAAVGTIQSRIKKQEETTGRKSLASVAFMAIEKMISFPERIVGKITDWVKGSVDEKLKESFSYYANRTKVEFFLLFLWTLFPAFWLSISSEIFI